MLFRSSLPPGDPRRTALEAQITDAKELLRITHPGLSTGEMRTDASLIEKATARADEALGMDRSYRKLLREDPNKAAEMRDKAVRAEVGRMKSMMSSGGAEPTGTGSGKVGGNTTYGNW